MVLDDDVDYAMGRWASWMRNLDLVAGYPDSDVSYKLSQAGYSGGRGGGSRPMPEVPDIVSAVDQVVVRMPEDCREFVKAWWGVDRYRSVMNPAHFNSHPKLLAARRRAVQSALRISRGTRSARERRVADLLNMGVNTALRYL